MSDSHRKDDIVADRPAVPAGAGPEASADADAYAFPLSSAQRSIWFMEQYLAGRTAFTLNLAEELPAPVDPGAYESALNEIVRRHESLRTMFRVVDSVPSQIVVRTLRVALPVVDLSSLGADAEGEAARIAALDAREPLDLETLPLFRTKLLRLPSEGWLFLLTIHHIVADGWSIVVFWREMEALVDACRSGGRPALEPLRIQYGDFASWQSQSLGGRVMQEHLAYWKRQLAGLQPFEFPSDLPRPEAGRNRGALHSFSLPASLVNSIRSVGHRAQATLFMTLLAAFQVLVHRYTGKADIAVGSHVAGRSRAELEQLIGLFLNTVVLRLDLGGHPTFLELMDRVRAMTLEAYEHQDAPMMELVRELRPRRDVHRHPFFEVVFQMLNLPPVREGLRRIDPPKLIVHRGSAIFDLACTVWENGAAIDGQIEYNTELYEPATIERLAEHFRTLLASIAADPEQSISRLVFLTVDERQRVLKRAHNPTGPLLHSDGLVSAFERVARSQPDAVAIVDGDQHLRFAQLEAKANRLARHLRRTGVGRGSLVGVHIPRSADAVVAMLAVLKAGAAFLPLIPSPGEPEPDESARAARLRFLVTRRTGERLSMSAQSVVELDTDGDAIAGASAEPLLVDSEPDSLVAVLCTSDRTGRSRGVAIPQRQVLHRLSWMWRDHPFGADEVACQCVPLNLIDSLWEIFGALLSGVSVVVVPDPALENPVELGRLVARHGVTRIRVFPSFLTTLVEAGRGPDESGLSRLRLWESTGDTLEPDVVAAFRQRFPTATLLNVYGTSEVWDAACYDTGNVDPSAERVPIGFPVANSRCYVLDANLELVPPRLAGALWVGGPGLAEGYFGDPARTAERFVPDPFGTEAGARMYRTGDGVRWRSGGAMEFLGRVDREVKTRDQVVGQLPPPAPDPLSGPRDRTAIEEVIRAIWTDVLDLPDVDVEDNFFDLGGHSLLLVRVQDRLAARGVRAPILDLFRYPTVRSLAGFVEGGKVIVAEARR